MPPGADARSISTQAGSMVSYCAGVNTGAGTVLKIARYCPKGLRYFATVSCAKPRASSSARSASLRTQEYKDAVQRGAARRS